METQVMQLTEALAEQRAVSDKQAALLEELLQQQSMGESLAKARPRKRERSASPEQSPSNRALLKRLSLEVAPREDSSSGEPEPLPYAAYRSSRNVRFEVQEASTHARHKKEKKKRKRAAAAALLAHEMGRLQGATQAHEEIKVRRLVKKSFQ